MWLWLIALALTLLVILRLWPRAIFIVLAAVLVLGAAVFFLMRHQTERLTLVHTRVAYDRLVCPEDKPLLVTITNAADSTLESASFSLHASVPGYSSTVTPYTYKQYRSDKILQPGEKHSACYPKPLMTRSSGPAADPAGLEWSARIDDADFR